MKLRPYILNLLLIVCLSACTGYKQVIKESLADGTNIALAKPIKNLSENHYLSAVRGKYHVMHDEYRINRFNCDSIFKLIFTKGNVTILYLIREMGSSYEITEADRLIFLKAEPHIHPSNKCYAGFIKEAKGYKVHYSGKPNRKLKFL